MSRHFPRTDWTRPARASLRPGGRPRARLKRCSCPARTAAGARVPRPRPPLPPRAGRVMDRRGRPCACVRARVCVCACVCVCVYDRREGPPPPTECPCSARTAEGSLQHASIHRDVRASHRPSSQCGTVEIRGGRRRQGFEERGGGLNSRGALAGDGSVVTATSSGFMRPHEASCGAAAPGRSAATVSPSRASRPARPPASSLRSCGGVSAAARGGRARHWRRVRAGAAHDAAHDAAHHAAHHAAHDAAHDALHGAEGLSRPARGAHLHRPSAEALRCGRREGCDRSARHHANKGPASGEQRRRGREERV